MPDLAETLRNLSEHQELLEYLSELHRRGVTDARILATLRAQFPPTDREQDRAAIRQMLGIERAAFRASQQVPHEVAEHMGDEAWRRAMEREFEPPPNQVFRVERRWISTAVPEGVEQLTLARDELRQLGGTDEEVQEYDLSVRAYWANKRWGLRTLEEQPLGPRRLRPTQRRPAPPADAIDQILADDD